MSEQLARTAEGYNFEEQEIISLSNIEEEVPREAFGESCLGEQRQAEEGLFCINLTPQYLNLMI